MATDHELELYEKDRIITALCEVTDRCSVCYREMSTGTDCSGCDEYYSECPCPPLTEEQILNGYEEEDQLCIFEGCNKPTETLVCENHKGKFPIGLEDMDVIKSD
jgi:hypothetical protein